jgi:hypothetical protein
MITQSQGDIIHVSTLDQERCILNDVEGVVRMGFDLLISCVGVARHDGPPASLAKINALDQLPFFIVDFDRIGLQNATKGCLIQTQESGRWIPSCG